jgi:predicted TIM-barrel fold metal-dependent hydrolase
LRWIAVLPLHNMDEAVRELKWAKDNGAVGVFKKGVECEGRGVDDPYFFPLYAAASELNIPICVHTGSEGRSKLSPAALDAVQAFLPIVTSRLVDRFPALRFGIIEAGVSWVPFLLTNIAARSRGEHMQGITLDNVLSVDLDLLRDSNIFVACQSHEDLAYVMQFGLEDNLIVGTDYTHADQSAELKALDFVEQSGRSGVISAEIATKILDDNPRRFFGL